MRSVQVGFNVHLFPMFMDYMDICVAHFRSHLSSSFIILRILIYERCNINVYQINNEKVHAYYTLTYGKGVVNP